MYLLLGEWLGGPKTWITQCPLPRQLTRDLHNLFSTAPNILFVTLFVCSAEDVVAAEKFNKVVCVLANWTVFLCQLLGSNNVKYKAVAISTLCISKIPLVVEKAWSFTWQKKKEGENKERGETSIICALTYHPERFQSGSHSSPATVGILNQGAVLY